MPRTLRLFLLPLALCCALADNMEPVRYKRGARSYRGEPGRRGTLFIVHVPKSSPSAVTASLCVDSETSAVRSSRDTWLRWKGRQVEFCRCSRGRDLCHVVPVINCYQSRCYNGGSCREAVYTSHFICQCPPGFSGNQCEINHGEKCVTGRGGGYRGTWSISRSGAECINWNSTALRGKRFNSGRAEASSLGLGNHNFCRNPDNDSSPWCFVYKGAQIIWDFCSLPSCPKEKNRECVQGGGRSYRGTKAVSVSGARCIPWDSLVIKRKVFNAWRSDALELGLGSHAFCRNPDGDKGPWCHVYKNLRLTWELCDLPKCARRPPLITTLGPRAPTTSNRASCGRRVDASSSRPSYRIFGGLNSEISEQPWQAAINIFYPREQKHGHRCGGVLVQSCWLLSAAHCFEDNVEPEKLQVILGRTFRKQNSSGEQIFQVEKYWLHEKFNKETYDNDIALLKLKTDTGICAVNSDEVLPACLPERGLDLPDWTECEISGYGKDAVVSHEFSERVKRGYVRLWPKERCVPDVLSGQTVTANMLCAGDTRGLDDACKGDSGGPLVCKTNGRMTLMGVISWGDGCGQKEKPGVYTRVSHYVDWIQGKMKASPV